MAFKFNLRSRRTQRALVYVLVVAALAALAVFAVRRLRRRAALASSEWVSYETVTPDICKNREGDKWFNPDDPSKCWSNKSCVKNRKGEVVNGQCIVGGKPAGGKQIIFSGVNCGSGRVSNGTACVDTRPTSGNIGGTGGKRETWSCTDKGGYIKDIKVRYDGGPKELKNLIVTCANGKEWRKGYRSDVGGDNKYEQKNWTDPHQKGWNKLGFVTAWNGKSGTRVRALGPEWNNMFGFYDTSSDNGKQAFDCAQKAGGPPPPGQRYVIDKMTLATGTAVDSMELECGLVPA